MFPSNRSHRYALTETLMAFECVLCLFSFLSLALSSGSRTSSRRKRPNCLTNRHELRYGIGRVVSGQEKAEDDWSVTGLLCRQFSDWFIRCFHETGARCQR
jgi:hypothetical protein